MGDVVDFGKAKDAKVEIKKEEIELPDRLFIPPFALHCDNCGQVLFSIVPDGQVCCASCGWFGDLYE